MGKWGNGRMGKWENGKVRKSGIKDKTFTEDLINRVNEIEKKAEALEAEVRSQIV
jgi:hypothetical protein